MFLQTSIQVKRGVSRGGISCVVPRGAEITVTAGKPTAIAKDGKPVEIPRAFMDHLEKRGRLGDRPPVDDRPAPDLAKELAEERHARSALEAYAAKLKAKLATYIDAGDAGAVKDYQAAIETTEAAIDKTSAKKKG